MHYDYFEWAPCIETFGFFSKCGFQLREFNKKELKDLPNENQNLDIDSIFNKPILTVQNKALVAL